MWYHFDKPEIYGTLYGQVYICDHPAYDICTLFVIGDKGLAIIQQKFDPDTKSTKCGAIEQWLTDALYLHPGFKEYFDERAGGSTDGLYPTVSVRQIMWALKMKPLPRERWETVFDSKDI